MKTVFRIVLVIASRSLLNRRGLRFASRACCRALPVRQALTPEEEEQLRLDEDGALPFGVNGLAIPSSLVAPWFLLSGTLAAGTGQMLKTACGSRYYAAEMF